MDGRLPESEMTSAATGTGARNAEVVFALFVVAVGIVAVFAVFHRTALSFIPIWNTESFGHGYLIVPISLFLLYLCRKRLLQAPVRPSIIGAVLFVGMTLFWAVGELVDVNLVRQAAFVGLIQLMFLMVLGWPATRMLVFPLGYLVFAIPFGEFLIPHLQDITAWFAVAVLHVLGIPTFNDGIYIQTPTGNYLVAEACSGSRYLLSTLAVSVLAAGLFFTSWHKRVIFVLAGIVVSIVANAMRAAGVILLAHWIDPEMAGPVHITYGLVFVAIVTLVYLFVGASYKERTIGEYEETPLPAGFAQLANSRRTLVVAMSVAGIALATASSAYVRYSLTLGQEITVTAPAAPSADLPWRVSPDTGDGWQPVFQGLSSETLQGYADGNQQAEMYIGYYALQSPGAELINRTNKIENEKWGRAGSHRREIKVGDDVVVATSVRLLPLRYNGNSSEFSGRVVWYWYWVGGEFTGNVLYAKFLEMIATLFGRDRAAALIAVTAGYRDNPAEAVATLDSFVEHLGPVAPGLLKASAVGSAGPGS